MKCYFKRKRINHCGGKSKSTVCGGLYDCFCGDVMLRSCAAGIIKFKLLVGLKCFSLRRIFNKARSTSGAMYVRHYYPRVRTRKENCRKIIPKFTYFLLVNFLDFSHIFTDISVSYNIFYDFYFCVFFKI